MVPDDNFLIKFQIKKLYKYDQNLSRALLAATDILSLYFVDEILLEFDQKWRSNE